VPTWRAVRPDNALVNALTDFLHPCRYWRDAFPSFREKGTTCDGLKIVYLGDGNNIANSLINLARRYPIDLVIGTNPGTLPDQNLVKAAQTEKVGTVEVVFDPKVAATAADVIYTDVWASMGQKHLAEEKAALLKDFQVNDTLVKLAKPDCLVMHCLPALRNAEITDSVMDGPNSVVFDQAENRLHIQKAIMLALMDQKLLGT